MTVGIADIATALDEDAAAARLDEQWDDRRDGLDRRCELPGDASGDDRRRRGQQRAWSVVGDSGRAQDQPIDRPDRLTGGSRRPIHVGPVGNVRPDRGGANAGSREAK
jgi:hypothetical protein